MLSVFNPLGELVDILVDRDLSGGTHEIIFNAGNYSSLGSGIYYYQLIAGDNSQTRGMVLVK